MDTNKNQKSIEALLEYRGTYTKDTIIFDVFSYTPRGFETSPVWCSLKDLCSIQNLTANKLELCPKKHSKGITLLASKNVSKGIRVLVPVQVSGKLRVYSTEKESVFLVNVDIDAERRFAREEECIFVRRPPSRK